MLAYLTNILMVTKICGTNTDYLPKIFYSKKACQYIHTTQRMGQWRVGILNNDK